MPGLEAISAGLEAISAGLEASAGVAIQLVSYMCPILCCVDYEAQTFSVR